MSRLFTRGLGATETALTQDGRLIGRRGTSNRKITTQEALRSSAVWACLRIRADLVSTMPVDAFRKMDGMDVEIPKPVILVQPGGDRVNIVEHMYSSQFDLDRAGNSIGVITERTGTFLPARIDLEPIEDVVVRKKDGKLTYKIRNKVYDDPDDIWHEKQYTVSGLPVGLSPIMYSALALGNYMSAAEFARDWFDHGSIPSGKLKHKTKKVPPAEAREIKNRFKAAVAARDIFVHGNDWEYDFISVPANESQFLETMKSSVPDICRYLGVPADMIDADMTTGNITYANVTQRMLQLLIVNLGPVIVRRETAMSRLLSRPRFVKLNTDALLRMDPATREKMLGEMVSLWKTLAPSEARALSNRPPFTPEQLEEFLIYSKSSTPVAALPTGGAQS